VQPDFYKEYAVVDRTHWWSIGRRKIILTLFNRLIPPNPHQRILDVGIGCGVMLAHLAPLGRAVGCDRSAEALRYAREAVSEYLPASAKSALPDLIQAGAEHLPVADRSLDLVTLFDILEHVPDDRGVLHEAFRALRPGGMLCATVPVHPWLWGNHDLISHHLRRYRIGELEGKMADCGLEIFYRTYFNTILFPVAALIRLGRRMWGGRDLGTMGDLSIDRSEVPSDFSLTGPGLLNDLLAWVFSQEAKWLRVSRFPFGVSLLCLARKSDPASGHQNTV
jgi:ubiquinone/menaquinone biosynthesis C-methylase UbiE